VETAVSGVTPDKLAQVDIERPCHSRSLIVAAVATASASQPNIEQTGSEETYCGMTILDTLQD
jgi:hypothetical protein